MAKTDAPLTLEEIVAGGAFDTTTAIRLLAQKLAQMEQGGLTPKAAPKAQTSASGRKAKTAEKDEE